MSAPSLAGAFRQIGGLTAISRVLGFLRDIVFAAFLGAGPAADAFLVALKLPNMFRRLTAEGAMANAFVPAYTEARQQDGAAAAGDLAGDPPGVPSSSESPGTRIRSMVIQPPHNSLVGEPPHASPPRSRKCCEFSDVDRGGLRVRVRDAHP